jgi:hypothetical protein
LKKELLIIIAILLLTCSLFGQRRVERPIQVQLNFSGAFLRAFGNSLSDSEVDQLEVTKWALPGISAGYHFRKLLYFGYSFTPSRGMVLEEEWGFGGENDGFVTVDFATGYLHNLELRVSPFEMGFYGQLFFNHIPKVSYAMDFQRKSETVMIGDNEYATDLLATWNFKMVNSLGVGFGFNWIHRSGVSANLGIAFPIIKSPLYENIVIIAKDPNIDILLSDLELARLSLESETFYFPVQLYLNIGFNFTKNNKETPPSDRF